LNEKKRFQGRYFTPDPDEKDNERSYENSSKNMMGSGSLS